MPKFSRYRRLAKSDRDWSVLQQKERYDSKTLESERSDRLIKVYRLDNIVEQKCMDYLTNHFLYACQDFETIKKPRYSLCTSYFHGLSPEYSQPIRRPAFFRYLLREKITYFGCKNKERKEKEKKILVRSSSNLRIPYSALIVLKELF